MTPSPENNFVPLLCPEKRLPLREADEALLREINAAIMAKTLVNRSGQTVERVLDEGLVREDRAVFYPVIDGIPNLLIDEAIALPLPEQETKA